MADSIGPSPYQGGIPGGGAPQAGRYTQQVEPNGAMQPANAQGVRVISGFGEAAPKLAEGIRDIADPAMQLWLTQAKSEAELKAQQARQAAMQQAQPGHDITPQVGAALKKVSSGMLQGVTGGAAKAALQGMLTQVGTNTLHQTAAFDQQKRGDDALGSFRQSVANKAAAYNMIGYDDVDRQFKADAGELNGTIDRCIINPGLRNEMRAEMIYRLTAAANQRKIDIDPDKYRREQHLALPWKERNADTRLPQGLRGNNPGNLNDGGLVTNPGPGGPGNPAVFATPEEGLKAMGEVLVRQQESNGPGTVPEILNRYIPGSKPVPAAYANAVSRMMGVAPDEKVDLTRPHLLATLMHGMIQHEYGVQPYAEDSIAWGAVRAAQPGLNVPPPRGKAPDGSPLHVTQQGSNGRNNVITGSESFSLATPEQKRGFLDASETASRARLAEQERQRRIDAAQTLQAQRSAAGGLLDKFYSDNLSMADILCSQLPDGARRQFVGLMTKGPDTPGNPALHGKLYQQVMEGRLTDPSQLVPYLGQQNGINAVQAQNLSAAMKSGADPIQRRFVAAAHRAITGPNGSIPDPQGDEQFSDFLMDLQRTLAAGAKEGVSPSQLLDPESRRYIGNNVIAGYVRSPQARLAGLTVAAARIRAAFSGGVPMAPNEDIGSYIHRISGKRSGKIESEPLAPPPPAPQEMIPGTNIPDLGVPEQGWGSGVRSWALDKDPGSVPPLQAHVPDRNIDPNMERPPPERPSPRVHETPEQRAKKTERPA